MKEEGRRKKEEGRMKKEEGKRKKEEGRRKKESNYTPGLITGVVQGALGATL